MIAMVIIPYHVPEI